MRNLSDPPWQYSKDQTRAQEIEECIVDGLEITSSIYTLCQVYKKCTKRDSCHSPLDSRKYH